MEIAGLAARRSRRGASPCRGSRARARRPLASAPAVRGPRALPEDSAATPLGLARALLTRLRQSEWISVRVAQLLTLKPVLVIALNKQ